jgi:uncharacterized protein (TIGR03663 family)
MRSRAFLPYAVVAGVALALRLPALADKPFHHDESLHAWFAWLLFSNGDYHYDPVYHGPVQFYATTLMYAVLGGAGDLAARIAPVLAGTVIVVLPYFLRRRLGSVATLVASALLAVSPSYLYFSRFAREDIYVACVTLGLVAATFSFVERPRPWKPSLVLGLLALSFATKESTYLSVAAAGVFFAAVALWELTKPRDRRPLLASIRSVGLDSWMWGVATFAVVFTLLFTTFLTNPEGLRDGAVESWRYWLSQQEVNRGDQPWFFYLVVIPGYEWPIVLLGAVGVAAALRRRSLLDLFLVWFFVASLVLYSWASERMPWLVLHPLLPLVLLAGIGFQTLWERRRRLAGKAALAATAVGAVYLLYAGAGLAYLRPADPGEMLVFTQTSEDVDDVRDQLVALASDGRRRRVEVDSWGGATWPWSWYLRELDHVAYPDMSQAGYKPTADAVLVADVNRPLVAEALTGYEARRFRLRVWWVVDYGNAGIRDWARWLLMREPWSPIGTFDEWLYVRS